MSVDISGYAGAETFFSNAGWAFLLGFAGAYGWRPAGTIAAPDHATWDGHYDPPEGQTISAPDAEALANAVLSGLAAPNREAVSREVTSRLSAEAGAPIGPFKFTPQAIEDWVAFATIAKRGALIIT
jgi:hypothetical protein